MELFCLGECSACHAGQLAVEAEVVLQRDRRVGHALVLDFDPFFRFHGLVQAIRPAAAEHEPAREVVDDHHLAVLDHVVTVSLVDHVRFQGRIEEAGQLVVIGRIDVLYSQAAFDALYALVSERNHPLLLIHLEVGIRMQRGHYARERLINADIFLLPDR